MNFNQNRRAARRGLAAALFVACLLSAHPAPAQDPWFYDEANIPRLELTFPIDNWLDKLKAYYNNGNTKYVPADLIHSGILYPKVGVQHKGDASYKGDIRENLKITMDAFVPGQNLLGYDKITLDAGLQTSVFSEVSAYWVFEEFMHCPRSNLAHVVLGTEDLKYDIGVLTNTERVDSRFIKRRFGKAGHRYVQNFICLPFQYKGESTNNYTSCYDYQGGDPATQFQDVANASIELEHALNDNLRNLVDPFIYVDACMINLIGNRMLGNTDGLEVGNNFYLVEDVRSGSRVHPIPWDLDFSFKNGGFDPIPDEGNYPLAKIFKATPQIERAYTYVRHILMRGFAEGVLAGRLADLKEIALPIILAATHDDLKSEEDVDRAITRIVNRTDKVRGRIEADPTYQRELIAIDQVTHSPLAPTRLDDVWVSARASSSAGVAQVLLWSRNQPGAFGAVDMLDDGQSQDGAAGDGVYGAMLPAGLAGQILEYYVEARPDNILTAGYGFDPIETEFRPHFVPVDIGERGPLRFNEILADNSSGDRDEAGEREDWIEFTNTGTTDHDLAGHYLSDTQRRRKWQFPSPSIVPAGGFLRVWADNELFQGPLHVNFKLDKEGETLFLTAPDALGNELLDTVTFGEQKADRSLGHVPDGDEPGGGQRWYFVWEPTGGAELHGAGEFNRYDGRRGGSRNDFKLRMDGDLEVGETMRFELRDGRSAGTALLIISASPAYHDVGVLGILCLDPGGSLMLNAPLDGDGNANVSIQVPAIAAGLTFYAQALDEDLSNAVSVQIKP